MKIEIHKVLDVPVIVQRYDLEYKSPLPHHMKMSALDKIIETAQRGGYKTVGCFCTAHGIWQFGLPYLAEKHGLNSIVCFPSLKWEKIPHQLMPQNFESFNTHYELKLFRPNVVSVNEAQSRKYIEQQDGFYVPFGVDLPPAVDEIANRFEVKEAGTVIVPTGSGVTLAGVLRSIRLRKSCVERVYAISAGRSIQAIGKTVLKHEKIPENTVIETPYEYNDIPEIVCSWDAHPYYELKAYDWLVKNIKRLPQPIVFVNIGSKS